jgi:hypothetical protein
MVLFRLQECIFYKIDKIKLKELFKGTLKIEDVSHNAIQVINHPKLHYPLPFHKAPHCKGYVKFSEKNGDGGSDFRKIRRKN